MRTIATITSNEMRAINRSAVLEVIRQYAPISRIEVANRLGVSLPTVMRLVDDLLAEDLIRPSQTSVSTGGRRGELLEFNASGHLVVGVDLGGTKIHGAITDLAGNILHEVNVTGHMTHGEDSYSLLVNLLENLSSIAASSGKHLLGLGVGVPGVVHPESGEVSLAPALNWNDFPLRPRLERYFGLPVVVENDVNLAALGELWFGAGQDANTLVLITVGTGIGAGVIVNGCLYAGTHFMAGEVGYLVPDRTFLGKPLEGFGALERLASGSGIAERARQKLKAVRPAEALESLTAEDVFEAARAGECWATEVVDETVDYLAQAIAAIQLVIDPEVILLGGGVSNSADLLIEPILQRLAGVIPVQPVLLPSRLGYRAGVLGAVVKLLRVTANYYLLQKFS